jgi:cyclopropane fatty-acyl-phospholipid synthase-like methyltransferase
VPRPFIAFALFVGGCARAAAAPPSDAERDTLRYESYRQPAKIVASLALRPGMRVADVGAGRGLVTSRIADAVGPSGRVVATDVDAAALAAIPRRATVTTRVVAAADPGLERGAYDRIFLGEVDHFLTDRADYFRRLTVALAPGGFIAVSNRLTYRAAVLAAANAAGLRAVEESVPLPAHFFIRLERP